MINCEFNSLNQRIQIIHHQGIPTQGCCRNNESYRRHRSVPCFGWHGSRPLLLQSILLYLELSCSLSLTIGFFSSETFIINTINAASFSAILFSLASRLAFFCCSLKAWYLALLSPLTLLAKGWKSAAGYIKDAGPFGDAFERLLSYLTEMGI